MSAEIVSVFFQLLDGLSEIFISVKPPGKKERGFYFFLLQHFGNNITAIRKLITGED